MHVQLCLEKSDLKILETAVTQEKCELLVVFLDMDIHPEELPISVVFSRLCQGMLKVLQNNISKT